MSFVTKVERFATKRNFILTLGITLVTSLVFMLIQVPMFNLSGGLLALDMRFGYTIADVNQLFTALGTAGRQLYSLFQIADLVFPIALALTMMFILMMITSKFLGPSSRLRLIVFIPLVAMIADYIENGLIATQLFSYPALSDLIIIIASFFTAIKWGFISLTFLLVIILGIYTLLKAR